MNMLLTSDQLLQIYEAKNSLVLNGALDYRSIKIPGHPRFNKGSIAPIGMLATFLETHKFESIQQDIWKHVILTPNENGYSQSGDPN